MTGERRNIDVSGLPPFAFGPRDPVWWGVTLLLVIEGTVFALLLVTYFYIRGNESLWPPMVVGRPALMWAALGVGVSLVSVVPMAITARAAKQGALRPARSGLVAATLLGVAMIVCRALEMSALTFRWDSHAHGSVFWTLIGLHLSHSIVDVFENGMLVVLLYRGPVEKKHLVDLDSNSFYWYFIVAWELVIFAVLYGDAFLFAKGWGGA